MQVLNVQGICIEALFAEQGRELFFSSWPVDYQMQERKVGRVGANFNLPEIARFLQKFPQSLALFPMNSVCLEVEH